MHKAEMMDAFLAVWNKESTIGFPKRFILYVLVLLINIII